MTDNRPENENVPAANVLKLANQAELKKAREIVSRVLVPDLPSEIIARAFMRLQAADIPREPWHWEVCQILQTPLINACQHDPTKPFQTIVHYSDGTAGGFWQCVACGARRAVDEVKL